MNIAIIGAGNMGRAIHSQLKNVWFCDPREESSSLANADAVILAIKPQSFANWNTDLSNHLVISIMTGVTLRTISEKTGSNRVVRSMPNLALKLGCSVTGWIGSGINTQEKKFIRSLFSQFGQEFEVEREEQLDSLTAISGSGPAYFLYFCARLAEKAEEYGFSKTEAREIAAGTLKGAAELLLHAGAEELIASITSKGGTTFAALNELKNAAPIFSKAVDSARNRAEELSL